MFITIIIIMWIVITIISIMFSPMTVNSITCLLVLFLLFFFHYFLFVCVCFLLLFIVLICLILLLSSFLFPNCYFPLISMITMFLSVLFWWLLCFFKPVTTVKKKTLSSLRFIIFWGSPVVLHLAPLCRGSLASPPAGPRRRARLPAPWHRTAAGAVAVPPRRCAAGGGAEGSGRNAGNGGRGEEEGDFLGDFLADGWKMMFDVFFW